MQRTTTENCTKAKDHPRLKHREHPICHPEYWLILLSHIKLTQMSYDWKIHPILTVNTRIQASPLWALILSSFLISANTSHRQERGITGLFSWRTKHVATFGEIALNTNELIKPSICYCNCLWWNRFFIFQNKNLKNSHHIPLGNSAKMGLHSSYHKVHAETRFVKTFWNAWWCL